MISLSIIKDTWIEKPLNEALCVNNIPINEGATLSNCEMPKVLKLPVERGGTTKVKTTL